MCYVPDNILVVRKKAMNKTDKTPAFKGHMFIHK